jgi:hypothetical protein
MKQIYFDRTQCRTFGISYFHEGKISLPADIILQSKMHGYDEEHQGFLKSIGRDVVYLNKQSTDAPGWYTVEER